METMNACIVLGMWVLRGVILAKGLPPALSKLSNSAGDAGSDKEKHEAISNLIVVGLVFLATFGVEKILKMWIASANF